jgi:hypothetical protein
MLCKHEDGWICQQVSVRVTAGWYGYQGCTFICIDEMFDVIVCTNANCCINIHSYEFLADNFMYPVLKSTLMLNFLDTSSMGVTYVMCCSWLMNYYMNVYVVEYDVMYCSWLMKYYMNVYVVEYDVVISRSSDKGNFIC